MRSAETQVSRTEIEAVVGEVPTVQPRRERRRIRRINEILQTSGEVLSQRGYHETYLDEIADRLDVSKASLYHYFEGKDALIMATLEHVAAETNARLAEAATGAANAPERLRALIGIQLRVIVKDDPAGARAFVYPMRWPESFLEPMRRMRRAHDDIFTSVVEEGIAAGEFDVADAAVARHCLTGALNHVAVWAKGGRVPERTLDATRDSVMRMFVPAPGTSQG